MIDDLAHFHLPILKVGELSPDGSQVDLFVDRTLLNSVRTQGDYRRPPILFQSSDIFSVLKRNQLKRK